MQSPISMTISLKWVSVSRVAVSSGAVRSGPLTLPRALVRLMLAMEDAYSAASRDVGLTSQQAQLLCLSRRAAPIGELAHALRCDRSNVSRMVDRAAGKGLVERRGHASDGRLAVVELTDRGEQTMLRFIATLDAHIERLVSHWPADRRQIALEILDDLAGALEAASPPADARARPSAVRSLRGI